MNSAIEDAELAISSIYWSACDAVKAAIDPSTLTHVAWAREYLAELHEIALAIEARPEPWDDARELF